MGDFEISFDKAVSFGESGAEVMAFPEPPKVDQIQKVSRINDPEAVAQKKAQAQRLFDQGDKLIKEAISARPIARAKLARAIPLLNEAINILPKWEPPYLAIAWLAWQTYHHDVGVRFLQTLLDVNPLSKRGEALLRQIQDDYVKDQVQGAVSEQARKAIK